MAISKEIQNLQPSSTKELFQGNYLTNFNFLNQFLPDVYEKEIERYGNRTISSFLRMVGAEMPSASDQIRWVEQARLHTRYTEVTATAAIAANATSATFVVAASQEGGSVSTVNFRVGQTVMIQAQASGSKKSDPSAALLKGIVTALPTANALEFTVAFYNFSDVPATATTINHTVLAYGSEFSKGTSGMEGSLEAEYSSYTNSPIIIKDNYQINGSDTAQIGWIEVTSENGANGYLWYLKSEHETRLRYEDYLEMALVEGIEAEASGATNVKGTEGFFSALEDRGNVFNDFTTGNSGGDLTDFDAVITTLDKNGAIEENMMFLNRGLSLEIDDALASVNRNYATGASYGVFNNDNDMALNLGFNGWRRGSYDFYKTDWKYLNDWSTRGGFSDIEGVLVPAGTSTVYDQNLGKNIKRPFLHVRYRASEADNRKFKTWITGSVGAYTNDVDEMRVNFLSERCLITQAANNFMLFKATA